MRLVCGLLLFSISLCAIAADPALRMKSLDLDAMDRSADPCQDFFTYACGGWQKRNPMPADQTRWGRFDMLREYNRAFLRQILEKAAAKRSYSDPNEQKIGDYYGTCIDQDATSRKGLAPAWAWLKAIDAIETRDDIARVIVDLHKQRVTALFAFGSSPRLHDAAMIGAWADQGGLSLPNRDFYTRTDAKSQEIRAAYVGHVANMLKLSGTPSEEARAGAVHVMAIETALAQASLDPTQRRNATNLDHWTALADFKAVVPSFNWDRYFEGVGAPRFTELNVGAPDFFRHLESALQNVPIAHWKAYLRWHFMHGHANELTKAIADEHFNFEGKVLGGAEEILPLWNRCVRAVDAALGEALGRIYVQEAFAGKAKEHMLRLVHGIETAMARDIEALDWMTDQTKEKALAKLSVVANKIGYPDRWRDYTRLEVVRGDRLGNAVRAAAFESQRQLAKIGKPVDRTEWNMSPQTVNAYYSPLQNNINFPAGILQPPFFDDATDDPVNYGGIGAVIGHELTHAFDDSGARFDADGNLRNWWSATDKAEFEKRTTCVAEQYGGFSPVDGEKLNGRLTLGENTADNGGVRLALMALMAGHVADETAKIDGFTPAQRFFVGFAQLWCENVRPERARTMLKADPHSPGRFRANGVLQNMPEFAEAFGCKAGQPMVSAHVCRVW